MYIPAPSAIDVNFLSEYLLFLHVRSLEVLTPLRTQKRLSQGVGRVRAQVDRVSIPDVVLLGRSRLVGVPKISESRRRLISRPSVRRYGRAPSQRVRQKSGRTDWHSLTMRAAPRQTPRSSTVS